MKFTRRAFVAQSTTMLALAACGDPGKPDAGEDSALDTGTPDSGTPETGADTAGDTSLDTGADSGLDTGTPEDTAEQLREAACAQEEPLPSTCTPTSGDGEGPYWRPDSPERSALNVKGDVGPTLFLSGRVLDTRCQPVAGVRVYLWSASIDGRYDFEAADPNLYGYQTTAADGSFCFETLRPPPYGPPESRLPAHLHLNFLEAASGRKLLTTQLRFAGDPYLDPNADSRRTVTPEVLAEGVERAFFDFVLAPPPA